MSTNAAQTDPADRLGCAGALWYMVKLPFMILRIVPHLGDLLRAEAATTTGERARTGSQALTSVASPASIAAVLGEVKSGDSSFDVVTVLKGVVRARAIVDQARLTGDTSAARQVMSDGLWRLFVMLLDDRAAHRVVRDGSCTVTSADVVAADCDQLAQQLRVRLACEGARRESADGVVLRGQLDRQTWFEDWTIRRAAAATTPANGGILSGRCPQCGAGLQVEPDGSCGYCHALVLSGGRDWVVWSIEEAPW
jgi:hypothetical protein